MLGLIPPTSVDALEVVRFGCRHREAAEDLATFKVGA